MDIKLHQDALLYSLVIKRWSASRPDKSAAENLNHEAGAERGTARVYKSIVSPDALKPIAKAYRDAREKLEAMSNPWDDMGNRMVPATLILQVETAMQDASDAFNDAVDDFVSDYDKLRLQAQVSMGDLFNDADYPTANDVRRRFSFDWHTNPVPSAGHVLVDIPESMTNRIQNRIERQTRDSIAQASRHGFKRIHEAITRLHTAASAAKPRVYATMLDELNTLVAVMPALNVGDDPQLTAMHRRLSDVVSGVTVDVIRDKGDVRREVLAEETKTMLDDLADML